MASTSKYGGASYTADELADPDLPAVIIRRAELGYVDRKPQPDIPEGDPPSLGNNSSPSEQNQSTPDEQPKAAPRKPARTTGNRLKPHQVEDSTADSTDGSGQSSVIPPSDDFDF